MIKSVTFSEETKFEREIIPGRILGDIIDMEINGIFSDRILFRFGRDLFKSLAKQKDKQEIVDLLCVLIKNMQIIVKEIKTIDTNMSIPICFSGQTGKFIDINLLPKCIRLRDILQECV